MAVKAINNTASPNGLVPTLLVYGAYLRIGKYNGTGLVIAGTSW